MSTRTVKYVRDAYIGEKVLDGAKLVAKVRLWIRCTCWYGSCVIDEHGESSGRTRGRPALGREETMALTVRLAGEDMERVDRWAARLGLGRAQAVRALALVGLDAEGFTRESSDRGGEVGDDSAH